MPLLPAEIDLYPADFLERPDVGAELGRGWWAFYLRARREKQFMRVLRGLEIPFYGPTIRKRSKSPSGRTRDSFMPLFSGYVFAYGDDEARRLALTSDCVSRWLPVPDGTTLTTDLRQIRKLIAASVPLTIESQIEPGTPVRVKTGTFRGMEGVVISRQGKERLLVAVRFLQQGASLALDDFEVERI
ncbi:MAG: antitermination protein NusG [Planctomycetia bacterium]|nr:antitermination protein NusG [Planctomycetia bacterium]